MPELPEVETVRRGLAPAMEGAQFAKVEVRDRRPALADRRRTSRSGISGKTVEGLGRRAKYLLADLSSGDVLVMHLGMSGSFRVGEDAKPGVYYHEKSKSDVARPCRVSHVERRDGDLQRSAPLRLDEAGARAPSSTRNRCCVRSGRSRWAMNSTPRCWRRPAPARRRR